MKKKNHWERDDIKLYQCAYCFRKFVENELADGVPNAAICIFCADKYYEALEVEADLKRQRQIDEGEIDEETKDGH